MNPEELKKLLKEQKDEFSQQFSDYKKETDEKIVKLSEENTELKKSHDTKFSEEAQKQKVKRIDGVVEQLLKEGKITPAHVDAGFTKFLLAQSEEAKIEFGEGDEKHEMSVIDFAIELFQSKIKGAPVHFGEAAPPDKANVDGASIGTTFKVVGNDESITAESLDVHEKTLAFMEEFNSKHPQRQICYKDALFHVGA